jgi:hypothetical protein
MAMVEDSLQLHLLSFRLGFDDFANLLYQVLAADALRFLGLAGFLKVKYLLLGRLEGRHLSRPV